MTKEMIKERFGEGLEKAKEFAKDNKKNILVFGGTTAVTLLCCRKLEKNAFRRGYGEALKNTAFLRDLGKKVANVSPKGAVFYVDEYTATAMAGKFSNLELLSKQLVDPEISKGITGVIVVSKE